MGEKDLRSTMIFFAAYLFIALGAILVVSVDDFSFGSTLTAVVTCIGNVGPGLEMVGPMGNFSAFSGFSKLVLSLCMILGGWRSSPSLCSSVELHGKSPELPRSSSLWKASNPRI